MLSREMRRELTKSFKFRKFYEGDSFPSTTFAMLGTPGPGWGGRVHTVRVSSLRPVEAAHVPCFHCVCRALPGSNVPKTSAALGGASIRFG